MDKPVFYDPQRKRWKRLRRIFDVLAAFGLFLGIIFVFGLWRMKPLPELRLTPQTRNYHALVTPPKATLKPKSAHRKTTLKPSEIPLNSGEGLRAAYYVDDDAASYSSLKEHIRQIDLLFPQWLHVISPDGGLTAYTAGDNRPFAVVDKNGAHGVDQENKVARAIQLNHADMEVFPLVDNYDSVKQAYFPGLEDFLQDADARNNFVHQVDVFLAANSGYRGLTLDFEDVTPLGQPGVQGADCGFVCGFSSKEAEALFEYADRESGLRPGIYGGALRRSAADGL